MKTLLFGLAVALALGGMVVGSEAGAAVKTQRVEYRQDGTVMEGLLAWDDAKKGPRPAVLVAPDWMGEGPFSDRKAEDLARMGYIALAMDLYGKGVRPHSTQEAASMAGALKGNRPLLRQRDRVALDFLRGNPMTDPKRIAIIGFCFGGTAALELARSGADIAGVVTFHGGLDTPTPQDAKNIKAKVLILHGADDPSAPLSQVMALNDELKNGGVDYEIVLYGHAVHAFTNPAAGTDNSKGAAYNPEADRRSWQAMKDFFAEILK